MFGLRSFSHEGFASVFPPTLRKLYLDRFHALSSGQEVFFRSLTDTNCIMNKEWNSLVAMEWRIRPRVKEVRQSHKYCTLDHPNPRLFSHMRACSPTRVGDAPLRHQDRCSPFLRPPGYKSTCGKTAAAPVFVHKFDLCRLIRPLNSFLEKFFSTGLYHVEAEVHGLTVVYSGFSNVWSTGEADDGTDSRFESGIFSYCNRDNRSSPIYRGTDIVGYTHKDLMDLELAVGHRKGAKSWLERDYEIFSHNCHSFSREVCAALEVEEPQCFKPPTQDSYDPPAGIGNSCIGNSCDPPVELDDSWAWRVNGWDWS